VIQKAEQQKVNKDYAPLAEQRFRPGDVAAGGTTLHAYYMRSLTVFLSVLPFFRAFALTIYILPTDRPYNVVRYLRIGVRSKYISTTYSILNHRDLRFTFCHSVA